MRELVLHVDFIKYKVKSKTKLAEQTVEIGASDEMTEALFVALAVQKIDEQNIGGVVENAVLDLKKISEDVKTKNIMLYPYVHLLFGSEPASPKYAVRLLEVMARKLKKEGFNVKRAPFGVYKQFEIKCKGHPLSELSREVKMVGPQRAEVCEALKKEETLKSDWFVLDKQGKLHKLKIEKGKVKGFNFAKHENLGKFCLYEMAKSRRAEQEPPHVALMKKLELANYEPGSDPGNLRYPPKGKMMKALIEAFVTEKVLDYGAMEIESPIMYDFEHPALKSYLQRFPARQYIVESPNKKCFLRFAACFGQFLMLHDAQISYRDMPVRMYEMTKYSFRVEKRGELTGLRRLRAFTMPDTHAFCRDLEEAKKEFLVRFNLSKTVEAGLGFEVPNDLELAIRVVKHFWEKNKDFILKMIKQWGKPALIEMWDEQFFYFNLKYEFNFVDALDKASALTTDQIDVENAKRYDITFTDKDNKAKHPLILHCSPSGAVERVMYALLEKAFIEEQKKKKPPLLPLWLSPTQVRLCPVSDDFLAFTKKTAGELEKENIRVDIDDRNETIGRKIRDAEVEWVPLTIVIGPKEKKSKKFPVRFKATGKIKPLNLEQIVKEVSSETKGKPFRPLPVPLLLSQRPAFN